MITTQANKAVLSNVTSTHSFNIKATARSFQILSSSVYANKIRAIIRELSTNAYDSHVASGNPETPFDVHLPNSLEPWFSIRDYGTGLNHDEVTQIYTTYFESTKVDSNDFTGSLGIGSKSPFALTDNFSVTAIKDNIKGIYTAFINDQGVPSIALMTSEASDEPNGVEVKFAVNTDYYKFKDEASTVYTYFKTKPVVSGVDYFTIQTPTYHSRDIIEGVHQRDGYTSYAVMGNIAYPIDIPNAHEVLGDLYSILRQGLEMHFEIGELDFQVSREGLSYIPETIEAIKSKLEKVNAQLAIKIAEEADQIDNIWDKTYFLHQKANNSLWTKPTSLYMADTNFKYGHGNHVIQVPIDTLKEFNIQIKAFNKHNAMVHKLKNQVTYMTGIQNYVDIWQFNLATKPYFVVNDTKTGAEERSKHHFKNHPDYRNVSANVYVINVLDKTKPMLVDEFLAFIDSPPRVMKASEMMKKEKKAIIKSDASIFQLSSTLTWTAAGQASRYSDSETYYYLRLSGFNTLFDSEKMSVGKLKRALNTNFTDINVKDIYGVRKSDWEWVSEQENWINLEQYVVDYMSSLTQETVDEAILRIVPWTIHMNHFEYVKVSLDSPLYAWLEKYKNVKRISDDIHDINGLITNYGLNLNVDSYRLLEDEYQAIKNRYPLAFTGSYMPSDGITEYIKAIDLLKGV